MESVGPARPSCRARHVTPNQHQGGNGHVEAYTVGVLDAAADTAPDQPRMGALVEIGGMP